MSNPFMQLYVADYLGDTRHLTTEQHGAYLLLLMTMWRADGVLPNDDKKLARIVGCTSSRWARIKDEVLEFFVLEDGVLTNARLKLELKKASEKSNQRAEAGSRGGKAKALKTHKVDVANATDLLCHSSEPEPESEREAIASLIIAHPRSIKRTPSPSEFAAFWAAYPKRVGKDAAAKAFAKAMSRITEDDPLSVILAGIERALPGWEDAQFIPHPTTWLNQGRWEDEAPAPRIERPRHDRPDHRTAKSDHLSAVARAMAAACDGAEGEYRGDRPDPRPAGPMLVGFAEPGGHLRGVG